MKKIQYIFVDLDGPILDGKYRHYQCYKDIINKYKGQPLNIETYWKLKRHMVNRKKILELSAFQGTYGEFMNMWLENIEDKYYLEYDLLKPKVKETLLNFRNYVDNLYLVTMRKNTNNLIIQLKNLEIYQLFDKVIACDFQVENPKCIALKNVEFNTALMIGDTEEDTETAKRLGIKCIGITNGLRAKELLKADYYVDELSNIDLKSIIENEQFIRKV